MRKLTSSAGVRGALFLLSSMFERLTRRRLRVLFSGTGIFLSFCGVEPSSVVWGGSWSGMISWLPSVLSRPRSVSGMVIISVSSLGSVSAGASGRVSNCFGRSGRLKVSVPVTASSRGTKALCWRMVDYFEPTWPWPGLLVWNVPYGSIVYCSGPEPRS